MKRKYIFKISAEEQAKASHTRRSRGYSFEIWVREEMKKRGYYARRLGGASVEMPDVAATKYKKDISHAITFECKAHKDTNVIWVPIEEVLRCHNMLEMFRAFKTQSVVLAFKFPKIVNKEGKTIRKLHYRFVEVYGFDNESEYAYKDIGYNLKKEELVFHWNEEGIKNVGYTTRGEDYDYTVYTTLDDLLEHLGEFHTENKELWLAQHN